jgi:hypothetical protein
MTAFNTIAQAYKKLPEQFRVKFRGRFTPIIGELVVYEQLKKRKSAVSLKSGQGSYDILVKKKPEPKAKIRFHGNCRKMWARSSRSSFETSRRNS